MQLQKNSRYFFFMGLGILFMDFVSKYLVKAKIPEMRYSPPHYPYGGIGIFQNVLGIDFSINHIHNSGAAWGILSSYTTWLIIFRVCVVTCLLIYLFFFCNDSLLNLPLTFISFGALGNIIDYFLYGSVIDMFYFCFWERDFPLFNIADSFICMGVSLLILNSFFSVPSAPQKM